MALVVLLVTLALAACASDDADNQGAPAASGGGDSGRDISVTIRLIAFRPDVTRVPAGSRVTWTQEDPGAHTVTSGVVEPQPGGVAAKPDGRFDSGEIPEGGKFALSLEQPGTYPYFCSIHPSTMRGQLQVF